MMDAKIYHSHVSQYCIADVKQNVQILFPCLGSLIFTLTPRSFSLLQ